MKYFLLYLLLSFCIISCGEKENSGLQTGNWHAEMLLMDNQILPFNFQFQSEDDQYQMIVSNADEKVIIDDIEITGDSITIRMPVYEGYISGSYSSNRITGHFIKESLNRVVPFEAKKGNFERFELQKENSANVDGIWETQFSMKTEDAYDAKGIFEQRGQLVKGTFRTNKGDYRYLEGVVDGDSLKLSAFDGAHVFLFLARIDQDSLYGNFYSGNHFKEPFKAGRNEEFELADADSLTFLKEGYESFEFSFPDSNGELVSLDDPEFKDKVVVVQIMGTWCPNCMDETKFLVDFLSKNQNPDLKVVALAFEYARTEEAAFAGINRLKTRVGVNYPVLLAQYGSSSKLKANEKLPMLNHVLSYPTTIFIDKNGQVSKIHTGFNGPATGKKYIEFKEEFETDISALLSE